MPEKFDSEVHERQTNFQVRMLRNMGALMRRAKDTVPKNKSFWLGAVLIASLWLSVR